MTISRSRELTDVLEKSERLMSVLRDAPKLGLQNWYVGAGAIAQTYWNHAHGNDLNFGISDYDLVYFDPDTSYEAEDAFIKGASEVFDAEIAPLVEIRNQARVHLWYHKRNGGDPVAPHTSTEDAISYWPTTATSVGVRLEEDGTWTLCTPFGLDDLLGMKIVPNKRKIKEQVYLDKCARWQKLWPLLRASSW